MKLYERAMTTEGRVDCMFVEMGQPPSEKRRGMVPCREEKNRVLWSRKRDQRAKTPWRPSIRSVRAYLSLGSRIP